MMYRSIKFSFSLAKHLIILSGSLVLHFIYLAYSAELNAKPNNEGYAENQRYDDATVTGENDLITGSFNYRTSQFDDGTDSYGKYSKDLFDD